MVKYRQFYLDAAATNKTEFEQFRQIHDKYKLNQKAHSVEFNAVGKKIRKHLDLAVDRLCSKTEGSGHGVFSANLADKFWLEVKKDYPLIDFVGVVFG